MITRPSIVSRLTQTLYPEGVPAAHVAHLPHVLALLDVVAEAAATGKAPSVPLALMAGEPCPYEPTDTPEDAIPFVPVVPVPKAPAPVKTGGARAGRGRPLVDWDNEKRLGKVSDSEIARNIGVSIESVRQARVKRGIPVFVPFQVTPEVKAASEVQPAPSTPKPTKPLAETVEEFLARGGQVTRVTPEMAKAQLERRYKADGQVRR